MGASLLGLDNSIFDQSTISPNISHRTCPNGESQGRGGNWQLGAGLFRVSRRGSSTAPLITDDKVISEDALALAIHHPQAARNSAHGMMAVIQ